MTVQSPEHRAVQSAAKAVLSDIIERITARSTERSICELATRMLVERGIKDTWYYECPALVLVGSRTCQSVSGRNWVPSEELVGEFNLVTIDLSPCRGTLWGDCARSIFVEGGVARSIPISRGFCDGHCLLTELHAKMRQFVTAKTTFSELYAFANSRIADAGFENLDFLGNVGHSIATHLNDRCYIEPSNHRLLGDVSCFTFEPHVRARGGRWGFKHENIYFFNECGTVEEL
jgi:hypothetical protein